MDTPQIPTKSSAIYTAAFKKFQDWCGKKDVKIYSENVLLEYFFELANARKIKSSTMWSQYSMIKSLLNINHGVDISRFMKLRAYLKKLNIGYSPTKSKVFTKDEFDQFMYNAPDEEYLGMKAILLIGIFGACRCDEMVKLKVDDIEDLGSLIYIKIPDPKNKKKRSFTIVGEKFTNVLRKYASVRPKDFIERRFFLKYKNAKCQRVVMGVHTIARVPKDVAKFLKLPNSQEYTGHCLRRTSATFLVDEV